MMTCNDCGQDHAHQREDYPDGSLVVVVDDRVGVGVQLGAVGRVIGHCADGRAMFVFNDSTDSHTFHHPQDYIARGYRQAT